MNRVYELALKLKDLMSGPLQQLSANYQSTVSRMQATANRFKSAFSGATQSVEELRRRLEQLKGRRDLLINTSQIKAANKEIDVLQRKIDKLENAGRSKGGFLVGLARNALPYLGAAGLMAGAVSGFSQYGEIDALKRGLINIEGSQAGADRRFGELREISRLPGIGMEEAIRGDVGMRAVGFSSALSKETLMQVGNALALTGGGKADLDNILTQYRQMASKPSILSEDLKPILNSSPAIAKAVKDMFGSVNAEDISAKLKASGKGPMEFIDMLNKKLATLERVSSGPKNAIENLGDSMKIFAYDVGSAADKAFGLTDKINALSDFVGGLPEKLAPVFVALQNLFHAFDPLWSALGRLLTLFGITGEQGGLLTLVMNLLATAINGVAFIVNILASAIDFLVNNPVSAFIVAAGIVILNLGTIVGWITTLVGWLGAAFSAVVAFAEAWWAANAAILACPAVWIVAAIAAIVAGIVWAWDNVEGFRNALIRLWEVAKAVFSSLGKAWDALMKGDFSGVASAFSGAIQQGLANAEVKIKADKAARAAAGAPKVPTAPTLAKPQMPQAPGAGGGKTGKDSPGKAGGLEATTGGTKSTTITINLKSLVERLNINSGTVQEGIKDMEAQLTDSLLRVLNSANSMGT